MQHARINKGGKLRLATYDVFGLTAHAIPDRIERLEPCTLRIDLMHRHLLLPHFYCSRHTIIARRLDDCPDAVAPPMNLDPGLRKACQNIEMAHFIHTIEIHPLACGRWLKVVGNSGNSSRSGTSIKDAGTRIPAPPPCRPCRRPPAYGRARGCRARSRRR